MADYKDLLKRAIDALPENTGGARRAIYEKARAALVGQLRAINPPLPARDITTHRLQLEDCIRQVEAEAGEANLAGAFVTRPAPEGAPPPASEAPADAPPATPAAAPPAFLDQTNAGTETTPVALFVAAPNTGPKPEAADPQSAVDRAIETLNREAGGTIAQPEPIVTTPAPAAAQAARAVPPAAPVEEVPPAPPPARQRPPRKRADISGPRADASKSRRPTPSGRGGLGALTIFLVIFSLLLVGAAGAGLWAWQEGNLDLDAMLGLGGDATIATASTRPPGDTGTLVSGAVSSAPSMKAESQLPAETSSTAPSAAPALPLALQAPPADSKIEERLDAATPTVPDASSAAIAAIASTTLEGSQSLLLEAQGNGSEVQPFSGTVEWNKGVDELGQPTLVAKAQIPARSLSIDMLIRKNADPSLPASHLMEISFAVPDSFVGGSIESVPGVLLKNEELVQGMPLVGASARVVANSFLFALSAASEDNALNTALMTTRKWMDLALIYGSGKRAIITLEKDEAAQKLFTEVFDAWTAKAEG